MDKLLQEIMNSSGNKLSDIRLFVQHNIIPIITLIGTKRLRE